MTSSRDASAQRKGRAHSTRQPRLHFGGRIEAKSISSFPCHKCRHLGKGGALRPGPCEGGALTSRVTPSPVAGKLQTSRALSARATFFFRAAIWSRSWDSHSRVEWTGMLELSLDSLDLVTGSPNHPHSRRRPIPTLQYPERPYFRYRPNSHLHYRGSFRFYPWLIVGRRPLKMPLFQS